MSLFKLEINLKSTLLDHLVSFSLSCDYDNPHRFSCIIPLSPTQAMKLKDVEKLLGETVTFTIRQEQSAKKSRSKKASSEPESAPRCGTFTGFIDQVKTQWNERGEQYLAISGYSPCVFLDCGNQFQAFTNKNLYEIANQILQGTGVVHQISPKAKSFKFEWTVQSLESPISYLKRLCDSTGELECYYDGEKLIIDNLTDGSGAPQITLEEGSGLEQISVSFDTLPQNFEIRAYSDKKNRVISEKPGALETKSHLINIILKKSKGYPAQKLAVPFTVNNKNRLKKMARLMAAEQANKLMVVTGSTADPRIKVGAQLRLKTKTPLLDGELSKQLFTVLSVDHHYYNNGVYGNRFIAIPSNLPFNLRMSYPQPEVGPLTAVVKEIQGDPDKMGRIRICFDLDPNQSLSPWIRLLQPYTGKGGCYLPPQVGDHIMVIGDQFRPEEGLIAMGSFYTGEQTAAHWKDKGIGWVFEDIEISMKRKGLKAVSSGTTEIHGEKEVNIGSNNRINLDYI